MAELCHVLDLKDVPRSVHGPIIVYDPMDKIDAKFADRWVHPGYPDAHVYHAPMAGHGVIRRLKETGNLKSTIKTMFEGNIPQSIIVWNPNHSNYHYTKGYLAAQKGRDRAALAHFKSALKIAEHRHIYYALIQSGKRLGESELVKRAEIDAYRYKIARQAAIQERKRTAGSE